MNFHNGISGGLILLTSAEKLLLILKNHRPQLYDIPEL